MRRRSARSSPRRRARKRHLLERLLAGRIEHRSRLHSSAAAACSISVDLPMPGIAADQGHRARRPGRRRAPGRARRTGAQARLLDGSPARPARSKVRRAGRRYGRPAAARRAARSSATRVFHSPQAAHCPCHFGEEPRRTGRRKPLWTFAIVSLGERICELSIAVRAARSPILSPLLTRIMSIACANSG